MTATHSPEEFKKKMTTLPTELATNPNAWVQEINVNPGAGTVQLIVFIKGEQKYDSGLVTVGKEVEKTGVDGRPAKIKIETETDTKITMKKTGANFETHVVMTLTNTNEMTTTMTCSGVTTTEKYKRI